MTRNSEFALKNWSRTLILLKFVVIVFLLVTGLNIFDDVQRGEPFDWMHVVYCLGFLLFSAFLYVFMRLIYKLVIAKILHDERRS